MCRVFVSRRFVFLSLDRCIATVSTKILSFHLSTFSADIDTAVFAYNYGVVVSDIPEQTFEVYTYYIEKKQGYYYVITGSIDLSGLVEFRSL